MGRKAETTSRELGRLRRAAQAVKRVFTRGRGADQSEGDSAEPAIAAAPAQPQRKRKAAPTGTARPPRREADIPLDVLDRAYTPPVTSSKASFRSDGADHQQDQEYGRGVADDRWNDEDHFTNKSGDPRIGTRRRTYEANEKREEQR
jgi:hypothetical protein